MNHYPNTSSRKRARWAAPSSRKNFPWFSIQVPGRIPISDPSIKGLVRDKPEPTVDLNLADAAERDIQTGDLVELRTPRGAVSFRARVTDDILQGAIEASMGGGTPVGPKAWREWNVNELTDLGNYDDVTGFPVYKSLLCEVVKIEEGTDATRRAAGKRKRSRLAPVAEPLKVAQKPKHRIYLDNNATTQMADAVREAMLPLSRIRTRQSFEYSHHRSRG